MIHHPTPRTILTNALILLVFAAMGWVIYEQMKNVVR